MRASRLIVAAVVGLIGLVWLGQGEGLISGSPMTGSQFWATVGTLLIVLAVVLVALEARRSRRR